MTYRIVIDRGACSGFGSCVETDPETFAIGADGLVETLTETTDRLAAARGGQIVSDGRDHRPGRNGSAIR